MKFKANQVYHIYNQGNNHQPIFHSGFDYQTFLNYTGKFMLPYTELISYCLMPNHFHFLTYTTEKSAMPIKQGGLLIDFLTNGIRKLLSGYTRVFNLNHHCTGNLFRQKTKSKWITGLVRNSNYPYTAEEYCRNCFLYIHQNPVAAGLVQSAGDWKWSSYNFYAGKEKDSLCNMDLAKRYCGFDPYSFKKEFVLDPKWKSLLEIEFISYRE
jgi:REP element-mobilizing transposase RayT